MSRTLLRPPAPTPALPPPLTESAVSSQSTSLPIAIQIKLNNDILDKLKLIPPSNSDPTPHSSTPNTSTTVNHASLKLVVKNGNYVCIHPHLFISCHFRSFHFISFLSFFLFFLFFFYYFIMEKNQYPYTNMFFRYLKLARIKSIHVSNCPNLPRLNTIPDHPQY